jgi:hypothetical protein
MKIHWTTNSIPELEGLKGRERRQRLVAIQKEGRKRIGGKPWVHFGLSVLAIVGLAVLMEILLNPNALLRGAVIGALVALAYVTLVQSPAIDAGLAAERERNRRV